MLDALRTVGRRVRKEGLARMNLRAAETPSSLKQTIVKYFIREFHRRYRWGWGELIVKPPKFALKRLAQIHINLIIIFT